MHAQPSSEVGIGMALHFIGERSLWSSETKKPFVPRRNDSPFFTRIKGRRGHRHFPLHPMTFAALAVVATAYLLLRCSVQFGDSKKPKGITRLLSAAEDEGRDPAGPCAPAGVEERALIAVGGELLGEEQVLDRAKRYASGLAKVVQESRSAFLQLPTPLSVKGFTNMLRLSVLEMAALCSLLEPIRRQSLLQAVDSIKSELILFRSLLASKRKVRASVRHIDCLHEFLQELPKMDFEGTSMSPADRLLKLAQLVSLQQAALAQVQHCVRLLAVCCRKRTGSPPEDTAVEYVGALHTTSELRRRHVFQDILLSRWLRQKHSEGSHFGLAAPRVIQTITETPQKPHDELLKELLNTPLGLRYQQKSSGALEQAGIEAGAQGLGTPLATEARAGQSETPSPPKSLGSPEGFAEPGQPAEAVSSVSFGTSARTAERPWPSESPLPQVTRQLETHRTALTNASAEPPASSTSTWAIGDAGEATMGPMPQAQPPNVPHTWVGGASEEQTGLQAIDETRPADLANQGRPGNHAPGPPGNHAPGPPVLLPMFPSVPGGAFPQMQSSAQQYSSGESPFDVSRAFDIWSFDDPSTGQAAMQYLLGGLGMPVDLPVASSSWRLPAPQSGVSSQGHRGSERPWPPFRGVAVGEPVEEMNDEYSAPAAHVAVTLFSSTSVDLSGGLHQPNAASR
ncbi:hypothetical protein EAH_00064380 [Eimeria acervulina]|uniref:Uncharacterized protein n=1 Tax=Eimeria acervulina TaxID=5801 RepID=U6GTZ9_EIMAC|nr:hypothetical protein EAH_00064380 [Eimeria acervulina]CDI82044.1 hypothetical protein EAH_00064380 [Eimeria acervulina]